jgi:hypothetical protein
VDDDGIGEFEADDTLGRNLNLLAARDGVGACADSASGCCSDGSTFAAAKDSAEDGAYSCSAADLLCGVLAAAFTLFGVRLSGNLDAVAMAIDRREREGEQGATFVVRCIFCLVDAAGDVRALGQNNHAFDDEIGCDGSGEFISGLGGCAIQRLRDADWNCGAGGQRDVVYHGRWRRQRRRRKLGLLLWLILLRLILLWLILLRYELRRAIAHDGRGLIARLMDSG